MAAADAADPVKLGSLLLDDVIYRDLDFDSVTSRGDTLHDDSHSGARI